MVQKTKTKIKDLNLEISHMGNLNELENRFNALINKIKGNS